MGIAIKPSDLKYKYPRAVETRNLPKFQGRGDCAPFNRDDLYDILPVLEAVMDELERDDGRALHFLEDLLNEHMPRCLTTRGEVFDFLTYSARDAFEQYDF